jgi:hypothetical protein
MKGSASVALFLWLGAGFAVWGSALISAYAFHGIGCAFGWSAGPLRFGLSVLLAFHMAGLAVLWHHLAARRGTEQDTSDFLLSVSLWSNIAAMAATLIVIGPTLLLRPCL